MNQSSSLSSKIARRSLWSFSDGQFWRRWSKMRGFSNSSNNCRPRRLSDLLDFAIQIIRFFSTMKWEVFITLLRLWETKTSSAKGARNKLRYQSGWRNLLRNQTCTFLSMVLCFSRARLYSQTVQLLTWQYDSPRTIETFTWESCRATVLTTEQYRDSWFASQTEQLTGKVNQATLWSIGQ